MKTLPLAAALLLALSAPAWARSPAAVPRFPPDESPYRAGEGSSRLYEVPPVKDPADPMRTDPPPASRRARERDRTRLENRPPAVTERGGQGAARPALGIPGQQPWGAPGQPSRGVPGQRPARPPKP